MTAVFCFLLIGAHDVRIILFTYVLSMCVLIHTEAPKPKTSSHPQRNTLPRACFLCVVSLNPARTSTVPNRAARTQKHDIYVKLKLKLPSEREMSIKGNRQQNLSTGEIPTYAPLTTTNPNSQICLHALVFAATRHTNTGNNSIFLKSIYKANNGV